MKKGLRYLQYYSLKLENFILRYKWWLLALVLVSALAHADYVDLRGGMVTNQEQCKDGDEVFVCLIVVKDEKMYAVLIDHNGERKIYLVVGDDVVLLWNREAS